MVGRPQKKAPGDRISKRACPEIDRVLRTLIIKSKFKIFALFIFNKNWLFPILKLIKKNIYLEYKFGFLLNIDYAIAVQKNHLLIYPFNLDSFNGLYHIFEKLYYLNFLKYF